MFGTELDIILPWIQLNSLRTSRHFEALLVLASRDVSFLVLIVGQWRRKWQPQVLTSS